MLIRRGWELEKTQTIERLVIICDDYNIIIDMTDEDIAFIDSIYRGRYPSEAGLLPYGDPSEGDAEKAVKLAKNIHRMSNNTITGK